MIDYFYAIDSFYMIDSFYIYVKKLISFFYIYKSFFISTFDDYPNLGTGGARFIPLLISLFIKLINYVNYSSNLLIM